MSFTKGGCRDLRQYMDNPEVIEAFGKLISGRTGYIPIIEKKKEPLRCPTCHHLLNGDEKFCPECGAKIERKEIKKTEV